MKREEVTEKLTKVIGSGDLIEGTVAGTFVMINNFALGKLVIESVDGKQYSRQSIVVLSEVESIEVGAPTNNAIRVKLNMKSGSTEHITLKTDANTDAVLGSLVGRMRQSHKQLVLIVTQKNHSHYEGGSFFLLFFLHV